MSQFTISLIETKYHLQHGELKAVVFRSDREASRVVIYGSKQAADQLTDWLKRFYQNLPGGYKGKIVRRALLNLNTTPNQATVKSDELGISGAFLLVGDTPPPGGWD